MSSGKVLLGLLAGVAAGALLGVLFAPEYADALKEKFNEFLDGITEKFDQVKEEVSGFAEQDKVKSEKAEKA
jgi:gas vesicle protein